MKIRTGFVSNSSSSSFCIYGVGLDFKTTEEELEQYYKKIEELELPIEFFDADDEHYIGRSWASIKDKETGEEFKKSVRDAINTLGLSHKKTGTIEEAWYNG